MNMTGEEEITSIFALVARHDSRNSRKMIIERFMYDREMG